MVVSPSVMIKIVGGADTVILNSQLSILNSQLEKE